jgi:NADH-quinone oxidoreductase subunit G
VVPECNSLGVGLLEEKDVTKAFEAAEEGDVETVIVLENDLFRRAAKEQVDKFFDRVPTVVVIDSLKNNTSERADVLLAAACAVESDGTLVNSEGRAQHHFRVFVPEGETEESWRWLRGMLSAAGRPEGERWNTLDDVVTSLADELDIFSSLPSAATSGTFHMTGQKIPRQPHRYSGRTAMSADKSVWEPQPPHDADSPFSFSMEGHDGMPPAALAPRYWTPGWNSVQALSKYQREVGGPLLGGDPGKRLIEPGNRDIPFFDDIPEAFKAQPDEWLFIPLHHVFGSEELSVLAPAIAERTPEPCLTLHESDAERLHVKNGGNVHISLNDRKVTLPVRVRSSFPRGAAGLPSGLPPLQGMFLPLRGKIEVAR